MLNKTLPETRHALEKLTNVPVEQQHVSQLISLLEARGVACIETFQGTFLKPLPNGGKKNDRIEQVFFYQI